MTVATAEREAAQALTRLLDQRYKHLKRELRRANFRKRVARADQNGDLSKAIGLDWRNWIDDFAGQVKDILAPIVEQLHAVERWFWNSYDVDLGTLDPNVVIREYQARQGRQIKDIAEETRDAILHDVTDWYNDPEATFPELVDRLGQYFSPERAEAIARTETAHIASYVARDTMQQLSLDRFNVDLAAEENGFPCTFCIAQAEANPHPIGDDMPPYHVNCRCNIAYVDIGE